MQQSNTNSNTANKLPSLDNDAEQHCQKVTNAIKTIIHQQSGAIPFWQFMQLALYAPGLGYYQIGTNKFGPEGDFTTAPEISPLFSKCLARQCHQLLTLPNYDTILELGAGSGRMACDILLTLAEENSLPKQYFILEPSPDLQQRQKQLLKKNCRHLDCEIKWLQQLPDSQINGIILGNEIMDALPVVRFQKQGKTIKEFYVSYKDNNFHWQLQKPHEEIITAAIENLPLGNSDNYTSEYHHFLAPWLKSLTSCLASGIILLIDYGFPRHEYYHPHRTMGTLMCHYKHHAHDNPLIYPGLQDITAHVDFTAVAETALQQGLAVLGYTTQESFLLSCGILDFAQTHTDALSKDFASQQWQMSNALKKCLLSSEMGELFKVIALGHEVDIPLLGFQLNDHRHRLG